MSNSKDSRRQPEAIAKEKFYEPNHDAEVIGGTTAPAGLTVGIAKPDQASAQQTARE